MEWIVTTGKTVEEALDAALDELGVDENDVEYEILEEPRRGFLGRLGGGTSARIRARVKPLSREKPDRRRRSGFRGEGGQARGGGPAQSARRGPSSPSAPVSVKEETAPAGGAQESELQDEAEETGGPTGPPGSAARRRRRRGPRRAPGTADAPTASTHRGEEESTVSGSEVPLEEQVELAETFTRGLVERFGLPSEVQARAEGDDEKTSGS